MKPATTPIGQVDQAKIDEWIKENTEGVFSLMTPDRKRIGYFKNPSRHDLNAVTSRMDEESPMDMYEDLAKTLWLGGDDELLTNETRFLGISQQLKKKMQGDAMILVNY